MKYIYTWLSILPLLLLAGCTSPQNSSVQRSELLFDTIVSIEIYGTADETLLDDCFALGKEYEELLSKTIETSEVYTINHAEGQPVTVSDTTAEIIEKGIYYGTITNGAFDITIAPLSELWDFTGEEKKIPDDAFIAQALSSVDYTGINIDGNTVTLSTASVQIDLGGIAKGYIADKMKEFLENHNIKSAIINLGGDIVALGTKPDGSKWNIGIQKPFDEQNSVTASAAIDDMCIVSSGSYERYFEKDGQLYHHILDPATGYPADNELTGVTVISEYGIDGDSLSTACFVLGLEKGMELINGLDDAEAVFITEDGTLHYSDGIGSRISVK